MNNLSLNNPNIRREIIRNATLLVVIGLVISQLFTYLMSTMKNPIAMGGLGLLMFVIVIFINVYFIRKAVITARDKYNEGKITFGQAFAIGAVTNVIAAITQSLLYLLLLLAFKDYFINMQVEMLENSIDFMVKNGVDSAQIDDMYDQIDKIRNTTPVEMVVDTFWKGIIFALILPLIIAAAIKKDKFTTPNASTI